MKYTYKARTKDGELQVGNVEASSRDVALNILLGHGLFVLSIDEKKSGGWGERITGYFKRVKTNTLMVFTRQFATLLASQVSLSDSLTNLYKQTTSPMLKEVIYEIATDVDAGFSLSQAMQKHPQVFGEFYINMVRSAEVTGRLGEVMNFLAEYLEKQSLLKSKIKNALTYPVFVIFLFFVVIMIMVTFVFPQIMPIFEDANVELPIFTKIILASGMFMKDWWWIVLIVLGVFVFLLVDYFKSKEGKVVFDELSLRIPVVGGLFQKMYIARFAESTRVLVKGGLTIPQAIEISSRTIGNRVYEDALQRAAEQVRKGKLLSVILNEADEFPPLVGQLVSIGEQTGRLEDLLEKVNDFYEREIDDVVSNLVSLIQPALMLVVGGLIGILFAAILLPMYSLTQTF